MKFRLGDLCLFPEAPGAPAPRALARALALVLVATALSVSPAFARSQQSLGDLTVSANVVPDWYPVDNLPLDTASWNMINATNAANASSVGCSRAIPNDGADDAVAINCMLSNAPNRSVIYLPAGEYHCSTNNGGTSCMTLSSGQRVLRGDGAGRTIITSTVEHRIIATDNWESKAYGASINWTGNYTRGTQVLNVASTTPFSDGDWVWLSADEHPEIDGGEQSRNDLSYGVKVTCSGGSGSNCAGTGSGQIRIDRPLRTDFDSSSQVVRVWNPYVNWGIENLTLRYSDNGRVAAQYRSGTFLHDSAESWIVGVEFENADNVMFANYRSARMKVEGCDFGLLARVDAWQKGAIQIGHTHDSEFVNNVWTNSHVSFNVQMMSMGNIFAYNRMYRPTFPGYQWCERSFFIHGGSAVEFLIEGNDFECGLQWDGLQGAAGHRIAMYRNRGRVTGDAYRAATGGTVANVDGSFVYHADIIRTETGFVAQGWHTRPTLREWLIAGNNVQRMGHPIRFPGWGINSNGEDMNFQRNVIRDGCTAEDAPEIGATGCEDREPWDASRLPPQENTGWSNNPVGVNAAPSSWGTFNFPDSLVYVDTPEWWCNESGDFPNIGSPSDNFGNPSSLSSLPSQIRNENRSCTSPSGGGGGGTPATFPAPILLP